MMNARSLSRLLEVGGGGLRLAVRAASTSKAGRQVEALNVEADSGVRPASEIPGPPILPLVGSIPAMMLYKEFHQGKTHKVFFRMADDYGPIVKFKVPNWPPGVLVTRPEDKQAVMRSTHDNPIRRATPSLGKVRRETPGDLFKESGGVLVEQGDEWWRVRKNVQTPIMKRKNVEAYLKDMDTVTLQFMERIASFQKELGEMPDNFALEMYKWALESVGVVALNRRMGCLDPNLPPDSEQVKIINIIGQLFTTMHKLEFTGPIWAIYPTPTYKKLQTMHQELLEIVLDKISITEEALKKTVESGAEDRELTLMEQLLMKKELKKMDVVTVMMDMIFGGTDSTANTMGFILYMLAKNPEAQGKLQEEVDRVLKGHEGPLTPSHLGQLSYAKAVLKETLRVFPVAMAVLRELTSDTVLAGYTVPKGNCVLMLNYESKHNNLFTRTDEFLPERWLRGNDLDTSNPYALFSFGHGTRMCIGRRIAEQEIYTFLARLMQRYNVHYNYGEMDSTMRLSLMPSKPWKFSFEERSS